MLIQGTIYLYHRPVQAGKNNQGRALTGPVRDKCKRSGCELLRLNPAHSGWNCVSRVPGAFEARIQEIPLP